MMMMIRRKVPRQVPDVSDDLDSDDDDGATAKNYTIDHRRNKTAGVRNTAYVDSKCLLNAVSRIKN